MFSDAMKMVIEELILDCSVETFTNAKHALRKINDTPPNMIMLDLEMEGISGLMLLDILLQNGNDIPILVCSGNLTDDNKQKIMSSGAKGFLSKAQGKSDIRTAIECIQSNEFYPLDASRYIHQNTNQPLTSRQLVILNLMQSDIPNAKIADLLCLSTNTIKTHIRLMYNTLDVSSRIECLNKARELGLLNA